MDSSIAQGPDDDTPALGQQFAQFGAGCFWSVELAFQRVAGVTKTEVGYSQGLLHNPRYQDVCSGTTKHSEVVRVQYDPKECNYETLLDAFWAKHDPTTLNRQVHIKFVIWSITLILFDYLNELILFLIYVISICFKCDLKTFSIFNFIVGLVDYQCIGFGFSAIKVSLELSNESS